MPDDVLRVQYIFHSGFLLETDGSYYIFDYYRGRVPKLDARKPAVVFASHAHRDHYNPEIFSILRGMGVNDVLAVLGDDISQKKHPAHAEVLRVHADRTYELPRGERLETLRSTDSGVAFVLESRGVLIYHAGDLNDWTWAGESDADNRQMRLNYRHEIDKLIGRRFDAAFAPLDPRQEAHYADGMRYLLSTLEVKRAYPMHYWEKPEVIDRFLTEYPQHRGVVQYTEDIREVFDREIQDGA